MSTYACLHMRPIREQLMVGVWWNCNEKGFLNGLRNSTCLNHAGRRSPRLCMHTSEPLLSLVSDAGVVDGLRQKFPQEW